MVNDHIRFGLSYLNGALEILIYTTYLPIIVCSKHAHSRLLTYYKPITPHKKCDYKLLWPLAL